MMGGMRCFFYWVSEIEMGRRMGFYGVCWVGGFENEKLIVGKNWKTFED